MTAKPDYEFYTHINPEKKISYFIAKSAGISNAMAVNASKFSDTARKIDKITLIPVVSGY